VRLNVALDKIELPAVSFGKHPARGQRPETELPPFRAGVLAERGRVSVDEELSDELDGSGLLNLADQRVSHVTGRADLVAQELRCLARVRRMPGLQGRSHVIVSLRSSARQRGSQRRA
jgi:hypothetical protein